MNEKSSKEKTKPSKSHSPRKKWRAELPKQSDCGIVGQGQDRTQEPERRKSQRVPKDGSGEVCVFVLYM